MDLTKNHAEQTQRLQQLGNRMHAGRVQAYTDAQIDLVQLIETVVSPAVAVAAHEGLYATTLLAAHFGTDGDKQEAAMDRVAAWARSYGFTALINRDYALERQPVTDLVLSWGNKVKIPSDNE